MTPRALPAPLEQDGYRGYVVRYIGTNGFKLALIVAGDGRRRVWCHFWRAAAGQWTVSPKTVPLIELRSISAAEKQVFHARLASAISSARSLVETAYA